MLHLITVWWTETQPKKIWKLKQSIVPYLMKCKKPVCIKLQKRIRKLFMCNNFFGFITDSWKLWNKLNIFFFNVYWKWFTQNSCVFYTQEEYIITHNLQQGASEAVRPCGLREHGIKIVHSSVLSACVCILGSFYHSKKCSHD